MSPKTTTSFRFDPELLKAMRGVKETEGIPVTTQLEMAVREWLAKRGVIKPPRKRPPTRQSQ